MRGLKGTLADLSRLKSRFERLLAAAANRQRQGATVKPTTLLETEGFGGNPGNLRMLVHMRRDLQKAPALVVALHGCTQSAADYDHGSGWTTLADACGFAVVFPEQKRANNPNNCFNWFHPADTKRGEGEALSIVQMINHMIGDHGIDRRRVFIVGLSAGGAMATAMLAAYPEVFAGGAIIAGLPYGGATNVQQALQTMARARCYSGEAWGELVRLASAHRGPWPKLSFWHGSADAIVHPENMEEAVKQWINIHGLSPAQHVEKRADKYVRRVWSNDAGEDVIEATTVAGMNHGVPIAMTGPDSCGYASPFHFDVGISSAHHIARFWGIADERAIPLEQASHHIIVSPENTAALVGARESGRSGYSDGRAGARDEHDPRIPIAAALKAAGLLGKPSLGNNALDPRLVIQNTLRSLGLLKE